MKKMLFLFLLVTTVFAVHAQNAYVIPENKINSHVLPYKKFTADTAGARKMLLQKIQHQNQTNGMPVVGLNSVQLTYQYNNGNGLDVYSANIDNMPVVKPDATFYSGMPNNNVSGVYSVTTTVDGHTSNNVISIDVTANSNSKANNVITVPAIGSTNKTYIVVAPQAKDK